MLFFLNKCVYFLFRFYRVKKILGYVILKKFSGLLIWILKEMNYYGECLLGVKKKNIGWSRNRLFIF